MALLQGLQADFHDLGAEVAIQGSARPLVAHASGLHPEGLNPRLTSYETANLVESVAAGFELMRRADTPEAIIDTTAHIVVKLTTGR